jgi:hypothetical protein
MLSVTVYRIQRAKGQLTEARRKGTEAVRAVERTLAPIADQESGVVIDLFLSCRSVEAWSDRIDLGDGNRSEGFDQVDILGFLGEEARVYLFGHPKTSSEVEADGGHGRHRGDVELARPARDGATFDLTDEPACHPLASIRSAHEERLELDPCRRQARWQDGDADEGLPEESSVSPGGPGAAGRSLAMRR